MIGINTLEPLYNVDHLFTRNTIGIIIQVFTVEIEEISLHIYAQGAFKIKIFRKIEITTTRNFIHYEPENL